MNKTAVARLRGGRAPDTSPYKKAKKVLKEKTGQVPALQTLQKLWDDPARWKSVARGHWQFPDEPIHILEGRTALMAIWHAAKSGRARRCKLLTLCDNTICCLDFDRGRARQSYGMLVLTRRAAAYEIGLDIKWIVRYIETSRNPADEGSRMVDLEKRTSPATTITSATSPTFPPPPASRRSSTQATLPTFSILP